MGSDSGSKEKISRILIMKKYIKEIVISSISVLVLGMAIMLYDYRTLLLREAREGFSKLEWFVMDDRFAKALSTGSLLLHYKLY